MTFNKNKLIATQILIVFILSLIFSKRVVAADNPYLSFIGKEQGLSNNSVTCIYQDHRGFMWFGTFDGLNRYDGYSFSIFRNRFNDNTSLSGNRIVAINEDNKNNIWVGTKEGISIYNNTVAGFSSAWYTPWGAKDALKITVPVKDIKSDPAGHMFIATDGEGLLMTETGSFSAIQIPLEYERNSRRQYSVQAVEIDKRQRVWVLLNGKGLYMYDYATKSLKSVNAQVRTANCIMADNNGYLWIGANDGLRKYDIAGNTYTSQYNDGSGNLTSNKVLSLCMDNDKKLWIATDGGGVNILDLQTEGFSYLLAGTTQNTIKSSAVYAVFADREGRKWIGTLRGGINVVHNLKYSFETVARNPMSDNSLVNDFVLSFAEDANQNLWIGTDGGGLSFFEKKNKSYTNYIHDPHNPLSLSNNFVTSICCDKNQNVWIATYGGGINLFKKQSGNFEHYNCVRADNGVDRDVWVLYEDRSGNIWAGTVGGSLYRFNRTSNKFEVYDERLGNILSMTQDHNGVLWAGNFSDLIKIDVDRKSFNFFKVSKPVRSIHEDKNGQLWLGTEGSGLLLFNPVGKEFVSYTTDHGLINPSVLTILEDDKANLWVSTFSGISKFDHVSKSFKNFDKSDGLQSDQFNYNAALRLQSGAFIFGGLKGYNLFFPDSIRIFSQWPAVFLTALRIDNEFLYRDNKYVTGLGTDGISALKIPYNHGNLSFDMAALEYSAPEKIAYAYFLEGWDKGWNFSGKQRTGIYSGLMEGSYTLKIKTTNSDGEWGKEIAALSVIILPPWYRSWWAYLLYFSMLAILIYGFWLYKTKQTKLEYEVKLAHLNAENEKGLAEKSREINEKRLSFFTNISHEFRTPLTLIINPIKDLLAKKLEGSAEMMTISEELNIINRNARRLLSLVDQLLLFRKTESESDTLKLVKLNFTALCKDVYLYFIQEAKSKKIDYVFSCENPQIFLYADKNKMEIVLYNLVSNAIKYTPEGGSVSFQIMETDSCVEILIKDSGYGIPAVVGDKIFEKFYQVERQDDVPVKAGFGIGLYLVKQFVNQLDGKITYSSKPENGTEFLLELVKGKTHFGSRPVQEITQEETKLFLPEAENTEIRTGSIPDTPVLNSLKTILVVDDDIEIRQYISHIFSAHFTVYEAVNGSEGLSIARQYIPDLIISDVMMTELSGIEMCSAIKDDPALCHIPVILLTAHTSQEIQLRGAESGADDYLTKPFDKGLLVARVNALLKNRDHLQNYFYDEITLKNNDLKVPVEYKEFLDNCISVVENYLDDSQLSIQTLVREMGMSHSNLYRKIKLISGQSANAFIRFIRLRKAAELFINTTDNVNEVASQVGFNDNKYFREQFFKLFQMNPSKYIQKYRKTFGKNYKVKRKLP